MTTKKVLTTPVSDADIEQLKIGDIFYLTGYLITSRDMVHFRHIEEGMDLPVDLKGKAIFWSWTKDVDPNWMLTPLSKRWMPPQTVIDIFEDEGFIWGGKWGIWDNMHFEYHPELILAAKQKKGLLQN